MSSLDDLISNTLEQLVITDKEVTHKTAKDPIDIQGDLDKRLLGLEQDAAESKSGRTGGGNDSADDAGLLSRTLFPLIDISS